MTDSAADIGYETKFKVGDGADPEVFTTLAEVTNITPPSISFGEVRTTHLNTPGARHTYRATLADPGEVNVTINYVPGGEDEEAILALFDRKNRNFEVEFPSGAKQQFAGFAKGFTPTEIELENLMQASFVIRVSGEVTHVAAPAPGG